MKKTLFIFIILISSHSFSQKIKVKGEWEKKFRLSDIKGAGNDYSEYYLSKKNQTKITVSSHPSNHQDDLYANFKVFVHREDDEWHPNLILQIRRTGSGENNNNNIFSGTEFQTITNSSSFFFNTIGKHEKIPIQYKILGISVLLPAQTYSTEVVFTVLNL